MGKLLGGDWGMHDACRALVHMDDAGSCRRCPGCGIPYPHIEPVTAQEMAHNYNLLLCSVTDLQRRAGGVASRVEALEGGGVACD